MNAFFIEKPMRGVLRETEIPTPGHDEILLKVMAAGLCGTDVHIYKGDYYGDYPRIPGHEFSGIVAGIGEGVTRFSVGQRVTADPNIFCESCDACKKNLQNFCEDMRAVGVTRHGAFAQYLTVPERCIFDIGDLSFTEAALVEPLACVVQGHNKIQPPLGAHVLIYGAGPIGMLHIQLSRMHGAATVTVVDPVASKLAMAKKMGAAYAYTPEAFAAQGLTNHYELVIDCTGIPKVVEGAVPYVRDAGTLLFFGVCPTESEIRVNPYEIYKRELNLIGSFALKKTFGAALRLAQSGPLDLMGIVDRRLTLTDAPAFFDAAVAGNSGLKTVFYPNGIVD